jgi:hypothetical protein
MSDLNGAAIEPAHHRRAPGRLAWRASRAVDHSARNDEIARLQRRRERAGEAEAQQAPRA